MPSNRTLLVLRGFTMLNSGHIWAHKSSTAWIVRRVTHPEEGQTKRRMTPNTIRLWPIDLLTEKQLGLDESTSIE